MLVVLDVTDSQTAHVVESSTKSDGIGNIRRTSLEASRRIIILGMLNGHVLDHIATTLPWLHLVEQGLASIYRSDTVRTVDLMSAEHEEISAKRLHINRSVGDGLRTVNQDRNLMRVCDVDDTLYIVDCAESVVHMTDRDESCARCDDTLELSEVEITVLISRNSVQCSAAFLTDALPRYDVGMVVEF